MKTKRRSIKHAQKDAGRGKAVAAECEPTVDADFFEEDREEEKIAEEVEEMLRRASIPGRKPPPDASREAFRQVGREVLNSTLDPEAWAQALAECRGTHDDALALYARIRSANITRHYHDQLERVQELESRRQTSFRDYQSQPVARISRAPSHARGLVGIIDSIFWHVLAGVGMAGCFLAARILWPGVFAHVQDRAIVTCIVVMQLIPIIAWWAGSGRRGIVTYPGIAQLSACVALFASVVLGVRLLGTADRGDGPEPMRVPVKFHDGIVAAPAADPEGAPAAALVAQSGKDAAK